ncbi:hypothetical protein Lal_00030275 [Lupinus albus]|nr:hypothetical protein Lal_00030275 [Lupinus albus]
MGKILELAAVTVELAQLPRTQPNTHQVDMHGYLFLSSQGGHARIFILSSLARQANPDILAYFFYPLKPDKLEEIEQRKQQGYGETIKNRDILSAGYLKLEERLLHYFLSYINWTQMIMRQMWNIRSSQNPLPYALFITKILEHFGVSLDGETKVALNLHESKIDIEVVQKMGFTLDLVTRHTYRHRTDRPTAPTEQPEPTIPD